MQFSGTGNTFYIARLLQDGLIACGHTVDLMPIEACPDVNRLVAECDLFGLGYPIYGSDIPLLVRSMIESLEMVAGKRAFVFCTQMMYSGDGAAYAGKMLRRKGFVIRQLAHFNMPNNLTDYLRFLPEPQDLTGLRIRKDRQTRRFVEAIDRNRSLRKGMNPLSLLLGLLQRVPFQKYESAMFSHAIKIDATCIMCGLCQRLCPVGNFQIKDGKLTEMDRCILCYRCISHCPVQALHTNPRHTVKYQYRGPLPQFSIEDVMKPMTHEQAGHRR